VHFAPSYSPLIRVDTIASPTDTVPPNVRTKRTVSSLRSERRSNTGSKRPAFTADQTPYEQGAGYQSPLGCV
jgi:hypothetical protein